MLNTTSRCLIKKTLSYLRLCISQRAIHKTPVRIILRYFHNIGSALGMIWGHQVATGLLLALYYVCRPEGAYFRVNQTIMIEVNYGWLIRILHFNGASFFFVLIYLHILKALYFRRWRLVRVWVSGVVILLILIAIAFLGYCLLYRQISLWAGVVIRGLAGTINENTVYFIWGGYTFRANALRLFYELHFTLPFLLGGIIILHIWCLHQYGRTNIKGLTPQPETEALYPAYWIKDLFNLTIYLGFIIYSLLYPWKLGEPLMFEEANPLVSPPHIVPEWYFCVRYAILRAIPNKRLGVIGLAFRVLALLLLRVKAHGYPPLHSNKLLVNFFVGNALTLGWVGGIPAEEPFTTLRAQLTWGYFILIFLIWVHFLLAGFIFRPALNPQRLLNWFVTHLTRNKTPCLGLIGILGFKRGAERGTLNPEVTPSTVFVKETSSELRWRESAWEILVNIYIGLLEFLGNLFRRLTLWFNSRIEYYFQLVWVQTHWFWVIIILTFLILLILGGVSSNWASWKQLGALIRALQKWGLSLIYELNQGVLVLFKRLALLGQVILHSLEIGISKLETFLNYLQFRLLPKEQQLKILKQREQQRIKETSEKRKHR